MGRIAGASKWEAVSATGNHHQDNAPIQNMQGDSRRCSTRSSKSVSTSMKSKMAYGRRRLSKGDATRPAPS